MFTEIAKGLNSCRYFCEVLISNLRVKSRHFKNVHGLISALNLQDRPTGFKLGF